eukprot:9488-Heterococcus_DN1.PRE.2
MSICPALLANRGNTLLTIARLQASTTTRTVHSLVACAAAASWHCSLKVWLLSVSAETLKAPAARAAHALHTVRTPIDPAVSQAAVACHRACRSQPAAALHGSRSTYSYCLLFVLRCPCSVLGCSPEHGQGSQLDTDCAQAALTVHTNARGTATGQRSCSALRAF